MRSLLGCDPNTVARACSGVGHRVVHGGARFTGPTIVNPEVLQELHASWFHWRHFINLTISRPSKQSSNDYPECLKSLVSIPAFIAANRQLRN